MELKICPDGQNKGFGRKSGKQRKEGGIRKRRCGGGDGAGGRKTTGTERNRDKKMSTRDVLEVLCVY